MTYEKHFFFLFCSKFGLNFMVWLPLFSDIMSAICIAIVCLPSCDVVNFEINLIFLIKLLFLHKQRVGIKIQICWRRKNLLRWNKEHFSSFLQINAKLKHLKQIKKNFFWRGESNFKSFICLTKVFHIKKDKLASFIS